ncbi:MAG TPA: hypothetical protein PKD20_01270 [Candidatus Saccharibacteria bacterium]|jgi:hypothetical protein|nr:hypothetical protein [Candidatus Saccharibacteria bacterium]HMT55487.1 hypothetical protein [Candidatus Saccharibacteria bacterium]
MEKELEHFKIVTTPLELFGNADIYFSKPETIPIAHPPHYRDSQLRDSSSAWSVMQTLSERKVLSADDHKVWMDKAREHIGYAQWSEAYWLTKILDKEAGVEEARTIAPQLGAITLYEFNRRALTTLPGVMPDDGIGFNMKHLGWAFSLAEDLRKAYPEIQQEVDKQQQLTSELLMELALVNPLAALMDIERMSPRSVYLDPLNEVLKSLKDMIRVKNLSPKSQELLHLQIAKLKHLDNWQDNFSGLAEFIDLMSISEALTTEEATKILHDAVQAVEMKRVLEGDCIAHPDFGDKNDASYYAHAVRKLFVNGYRQLPMQDVQDAEKIFNTRYMENAASRTQDVPSDIFSSRYMQEILQEKLRLPDGLLSQADKTVLRKYFGTISSETAENIFYLPLEPLRANDIISNDEVIEFFDVIIRRAFPYKMDDEMTLIDSYALLGSVLPYINAQVQAGMPTNLVPTAEIRNALEIMQARCKEEVEVKEDARHAIDAYFRGEIEEINIDLILSERLTKQDKKRLLYEDRMMLSFELDNAAKLYVVETLYSRLAADVDGFLCEYKKPSKSFREHDVDDEDFSNKQRYEKWHTHRDYKKWGFKWSYYF